ncbi:hypothetical protein RSK20926_02454 [Roseobacter sp. SK209-2-6]|uniref:hypothetical protein n=1 Tax=Roseobacter sp. SK209-2-6 TaxID=388739 RepID=UPI0000F3EBFE|nr:hypothetical protein [Roseobacter sp. SK209-2-6]EBA16629.1 hypothetical protein RSK20926_02454 [Roseobacter sp. SK209-2-6]
MTRTLIFSSLFCLSFLPAAQAVSAQAATAALNEAKARLACGAGTPVSASYLPGGSVKVTCRSNAPSSGSESVLGDTALNPITPGLAPIATAIVVGVLVGDSGETSTTTTTTDSGGGGE